MKSQLGDSRQRCSPSALTTAPLASVSPDSEFLDALASNGLSVLPQARSGVMSAGIPYAGTSRTGTASKRLWRTSPVAVWAEASPSPNVRHHRNLLFVPGIREATRTVRPATAGENPSGPAARLAAVVLFFEIMLVAAVVVITWFALYALYRLITDES